MGKWTSVRTKLREHTAWQTAQKRTGRLPESELLAWWETTLYASQRMCEAYAKDRDPMALREGVRGVTELLAVLEELEKRGTQ